MVEEWGRPRACPGGAADGAEDGGVESPPPGGAPVGAAGDEAEVGAEVAVRRQRLQRWRERGIDPYGARFERTHLAATIQEAFEALAGEEVAVAGRIMALRRQGKAAFADLHDRSGRIQAFARPDGLGADGFDAFLQCELGDIVGVRGTVMRTRAGEVSVEATGFTLLTKALRPLPDKRHGLRDIEARSRQRYLDLVANPEVRERFARRSRITAAVRGFLQGRGFLEVETPVLQTLAGGTTARPFRTHHHALNMELYLRIALELHLKRLIVGGLERVYEIGRVFRNEGLSTRHNPEFTMLELYQAYADYQDMMRLTEEMVATVAAEVCGTTVVRWKGQQIDLRPPWRRLSMVQALSAKGLPVLETETPEAARALAARAGVEVPPGSSRGQVMDALVEALILPELVQPTFLLDHPVEISPLARAKAADPRLTDRFEAIVGGMELANAFSELNDPDEQRRRFVAQVREREAGNEEAHVMDEDFLRALEHGMPPTGGLGVGMDRLTMLLLDVESIRDVILFPLLRPR